MNVLVAGATGMVGGVTAQTLASRGQNVRALVRKSSNTEKRSALEASGIEIAEGDLRDSASLDAACAGMDAVISTVSAMPFSWAEDNAIDDVDRTGQIALISAAKKAGVSKYVYVSFPLDTSNGFPLADAKSAVATHLEQSGLDFTILEANLFMEVWLSPAFGFDAAAKSATVFGDGTNPITWVSFLDVARAAVEALSNGKAKNATIPVGGPDSFTPNEVVGVFERVGNAPWKVEYVPAESLRQQRDDATDEVQKSVAGLQLGYATGNWKMSPSTYIVADGLKSVEAYARESLG